MAQFKRFNASENDNYDTSAVYPSGTLTWDPDNGLRLHDGNTSGGLAVGGGGGNLTAVDNNIQIVVSDANQNYYNIRQIIDDNNGNNYTSTDLNYEQFSIRTDQQNNGGYEWRFDSNGEFRVPGNMNTYDADLEIRAMNAGNAGNITIKTVSHINNIHYSQIQLNQGGINITTDMDVTSGGKSFEFRDTGVLVLPSGGDIHNSSGNSVIVPQALGTGDSPEFAGLYINGSSGNEGGQIRLALPANTGLGGDGIGIDIFENKLRIFENGGTARGVYIDLTAAEADVGTDLLAGGGGGNIDLSAVDQDIIPDGNLTRSLGSPTNQWADLYIGNATIYLNNIPLGLNSASQLTFNGNVIADGGGGGGGTSYNQSLNTSDDVLFNSVGSVDGFVCVGAGTPTVEGDTDLILKASHRILIDTGVLNIPTRTSAEVGNISLTDGDMYVRDEDGVLRAFVQSRECSVMLRVAVPTTSLGASGDVPGLYATDSSYFYVCLNQYDGTTNIWRRITIPSTTW